MRSPTSGITSAITAQGSFQGWLMAITVGPSVVRVCTMDVDFPFGGNTFNANGFTVSGMKWDGGISLPTSVTVPDASLAYWALVLNLQLIDAPVQLWQAYVDAPTEAQPLWLGRVGKCTRAGLTVQIELVNDSATAQSPRLRTQQLVNPLFMLAAGTTLKFGGQRWILDRQ
jgi:hypothetical protein